MCLLVVSLSVAIGTGGARAEDLAEVYALARQHDPELRAAHAKRLAALEALPQARALLLPSLTAGANISRERFDDDNPAPGSNNPRYSTNQTYSVSLAQPLFRYDRIVQYRQAGDRILQAEAEYAASEQQLILRTAERYFDVLAAEDDVLLTEAQTKAIGRQLEQAKQRFEVGLSAITDVQEAQGRYDQAVAEEIQARNNLESARDALREIVGTYIEHHARLAGDIELVRPDPESPDAWVETAFSQNLSITSAKAALEIARHEIERKRAGHYPTVDMTAEFARRDVNFGGIAPLERNDASIGVQLALPLYQGGLVRSRTREAQHLFDEARETLEDLRRATERQTRDAYRGIINGISQVKAQKQAVLSTRTALQAAETGFEVGTRTIVQVLDSQREHLRAQRNYARARYDYLLNTLRLKQAAGTLSGEDVTAVNRWLSEDAKPTISTGDGQP